MKKNKNIAILISIIICLLLMMASAYKIVNWYSDTKEVKRIKQDINKHVKSNNNIYKIDFKKLKEQNPDTVAYIKVNNTNIDYIVVKGNDNDYYLHHSFRQKPNTAGWVFASYQNKIDGTDKNIVIFGHNMRDGSMFGTLKRVLTKKWYNNKDNQSIKLVAEQGTFTYKVFSIYQVMPEDYYIQTDFNNDKQYANFLKTIKARSINDFGISITKDDSILTLSTCSSTGKERVVLHAKKV